MPDVVSTLGKGNRGPESLKDLRKDLKTVSGASKFQVHIYVTNNTWTLSLKYAGLKFFILQNKEPLQKYIIFQFLA